MTTSFLRIVQGLVFLLAQFICQAQDFELVTHRVKVTVVYGRQAPAIDSICAYLLAQDIEKVTGYRPRVTSDLSTAKGNIVVIGGMQSSLVQKFISRQSALYKSLQNKWECFGLKVVEKPTAAISKALLIAGSDARGTAYGVFSLSEKIGVSPWWWWADVPVKQQASLTIHQPEVVSAPPSVKYRGIFINDEDWGLRPWAASTFEPEKKNIGPKTYAKVFELLLRLKANLLWPAMHPGTEPFYNDSANKKMAAAFSIVIGSSHAEPMLRNNVGEWDEKKLGDFNYITNKDKVYRYWEERVKQSSGNDVVYTVGMRGVHDSGIEGVKDAKEAVPLLERIIKDQREMLTKHLQQNITSIPQAFTAYKEVLDIYDSGLTLPDDVTLVWPDDNYGYIQRLNNAEEKTLSGGSGVYYHASYWGRPHDYLWLSTTHPSLIREEMMKAYDAGAKRLWVLNVGDIKPLEYNLQLFCDMAYNAVPFKESRYTKRHLLNWTEKAFGEVAGNSAANILWRYYNLAFERRPEFMGWSQTEPTTKTTYTAYNHFYYGDEAQRRIDRYDSLEKEARQLRQQTEGSRSAAFYELVYYPVVCASLMNKKFLFRDKAYLYSIQGRISAFNYAEQSRQAYDSIVKETSYFNEVLKGGKWKNMMSMSPRDLPVFQPPVQPPISLKNGLAWTVAPEGYDTAKASLNNAEKQLPTFYSGCPQQFFIDVFLGDSTPVKWTAKPSVDWIVLSSVAGTLTDKAHENERRVWVSIDWQKAPNTQTLNGKIFFTAGDGKIETVDVRAVNLKALQRLAAKKGFLETNGYVSIYAQHFSKAVNTPIAKWVKLEGLGHTGASLLATVQSSNTSMPVLDTLAIKQKAASVAYNFYTFSETPPQLFLYALPTHPLNKTYSVRCAFSIDDAPLQTVDFKTTGRSEEWKQNVLRNSAIKAVGLPVLKAGWHTVNVYTVDPGLILDRLLIRFGERKNAYSLVPETKIF